MQDLKINAVCMDPKDSVVTVTVPVEPGDAVCWLWGKDRYSVTAVEKVPQYHKIAVKDAKKGEYVLKYGEKIGVATKEIKTGQHVHVQNLASESQQ